MGEVLPKPENMTAVVGILNKSAAAIAADSAVTVTGSRGAKIFNSANKIFRISRTEPIGVMIYNQGEFMGTPWDTILKLYRSSLNSTSFAKVADYKDHFIRFLKSNDFFCDTVQQKRTLHAFTQQAVNELVGSILRKEQNLINSQQSDIGRKLAEKLNEKIDKYINAPLKADACCEDFKDFEMEEFDEFGFSAVPAIVGDIISKGILVEHSIFSTKIKQLVFKLLKEGAQLNFYSGLVFIGFGTAEIFPSLCAINISLALNNRLRYFEDKKNSVNITHQLSSAICPFAQHDVINTVLAGVDPLLNKFYLENFSLFLSKNNDEIAKLIQAIDPVIAEKISAISTRNLTQKLVSSLSQETRKMYIEPTLQAVSTLSKEDLSEMAESLIYITYLKRRFTFSAESVGGPVDVAIITKTDGFIWIKRKHYFDIALNQHFLKNY